MDARSQVVARAQGGNGASSRVEGAARAMGGLVQWDNSEHDWLEGSGEKMHLIKMIDDATSRLFARFVRHDSTVENMCVLEQYVRRYGRPLEFYTDRAGLLVTMPKK